METFEQQMARAYRESRAEVITSKHGDAVIAPRGGEPGYIALRIGESRTWLVTSDGAMLDHSGWCEHGNDGIVNSVYFEWVSEADQSLDGSHGWAHIECRRVSQVG